MTTETDEPTAPTKPDKDHPQDAKKKPAEPKASGDKQAADLNPKSATRHMSSLVLPIILLLMLLFILVQWIRQSAQIPSDDDLRQAGAYIQQHYVKDDAVVVSPSWALRSLQYLGSINATFYPQLVEHPPEAERLWILAEAEGQAKIKLLAKKFKVLKRQDFGRVQVALFSIGEQRSFHATDHVAEAKVQIQTKSSKVACDQWKNDKWSCRGRPDWQHVGVEALDVDLAPRRIIWAHPPPAGEQLHVRFDNVPLAQAIDVMAGNTVHGAQFGKAPIVIDLYIDDKKIASHDFSGYPLQRWRVDTSSMAEQKHSIQLSIHTSDNGANHFAFDFVVVNH